MEEDNCGGVERFEIGVELMVGLLWNCTACCGHGIPFHVVTEKVV